MHDLLLRHTFPHPAYIHLKNVFTKSDVEGLAATLSAHELMPARLHKNLDESYQNQNCLMTQLAHDGPLTERLKSTFHTYNSELWKLPFEITFNCKYLEYPVGSSMSWHKDASTDTAVMYLITMVAMITSVDEYSGGELELTDWVGNNTLFKLDQYDLLMFPSYLNHQVRDITRGSRKSIVLIAQANGKLK